MNINFKAYKGFITFARVPKQQMLRQELIYQGETNISTIRMFFYSNLITDQHFFIWLAPTDSKLIEFRPHYLQPPTTLHTATPHPRPNYHAGHHSLHAFPAMYGPHSSVFGPLCFRFPFRWLPLVNSHMCAYP